MPYEYPEDLGIVYSDDPEDGIGFKASKTGDECRAEAAQIIKRPLPEAFLAKTRERMERVDWEGERQQALAAAKVEADKVSENLRELHLLGNLSQKVKDAAKFVTVRIREAVTA